MNSKTYTATDHLLRWISIAFATLFVINYFAEMESLRLICAFFLIIILSQSFRQMRPVNLRVVGGLFLAGAVILIWSRADIHTWLEALMQNASLATMFTAAPMLALPFYYEDYQGELARFARFKMQSLSTFMLLNAFSGFFLSLLVGVGAVVIAYEMFYPHSKMYDAEELFYPSLTRYNCSPGFLAPAWASIAVTTMATGTPWVSLVPIGLAFACVYILIDMIMLSIHIRRRPGRYPKLQPIAGEKVNYKRIFIMLLLAVIMLGMIGTINATTGWSLMIVIPIVAISFPLLTALFQRKIPAYRAGMAQYYDKSLLKVRTEIGLFTAAGFLGKALEASGIGAKIPALLPDWLHAYPVFMIIAIMLVIILPSLVGIHAVATGSALLAALTPAAVGMNQMTFVLTVLAGWMISIIVSPFSGAALIVGGYAEQPPWQISLGKNGPFGLACLIVFSLLIYLIGPFLQV